jgi:hypothetical protein
LAVLRFEQTDISETIRRIEVRTKLGEFSKRTEDEARELIKMKCERGNAEKLLT